MAAVTGQGHAGSNPAPGALETIQLHRRAGFSGSLGFEQGGQVATVYLQHGEVVHAEAGEARGEEALRTVASWSGAGARAHANVSTFARTIGEREGAALLEVLELGTGRPASTPPPLPAATPQPFPVTTPQPFPRSSSPTTDRARTVPGVTYAAVLRGGTAVNDPDPRAEALSHRSALLLSRLALPLSKALGLGDLTRGAIASPDAEQMLLFHAQDAYLAVAVAPGAPLSDVEAGIRRALSTRRGE